MKQTEHEEKQEGPATRSVVLEETPEETEARIQKEIKEGKRAPAPESIDQTKSTVTGEQVQAMADAAPQPFKGERQEGNGEVKDASTETNEQDLEENTVDELREIARDENVELHGAYAKADIIKAIKKNRKKA